MFEERYKTSCSIIETKGYKYYKKYYEEYNYNNMPTVAIKVAKKFNIINNKYLLLAIRLYDLEYIKLYLSCKGNKLDIIEDMIINTRNLLFIDNFIYGVHCSKKLLEADYEIRWDINNSYSRKLK